MNLLPLGNDILTNNEVTNITKIGFWVLINGREYFIPFKEFPIFRKATIEQILEIKLLSPNQLYWESLDCDIELESLEKPHFFPLMFQ